MPDDHGAPSDSAATSSARPADETLSGAASLETAGPESPDRGAAVTRLLIGICVVVFLGIHFRGNPQAGGALEAWGIRQAPAIWDGAYWALWPPAVTHVEIWHLVMNMSFLWTLGGRMERTIGPGRFLLFCLTAAPVASGWQLAMSGTTGIGFSGVGFAIFGFLWAGAAQHPEFGSVIHRDNLRMILGWLVLCFVLSWTGTLPIANAAHVSGLLWGAAVAWTVSATSLAIPGALGLAGLVTGTIVPLFWAPWLALWLNYQAYLAYEAKNLPATLEYLDRALARDPENSWAAEMREAVQREMQGPRPAIAE